MIIAIIILYISVALLFILSHYTRDNSFSYDEKILKVILKHLKEQHGIIVKKDEKTLDK